jgi:hypothetical protein
MDHSLSRAGLEKVGEQGHRVTGIGIPVKSFRVSKSNRGTPALAQLIAELTGRPQVAIFDPYLNQPNAVTGFCYINGHCWLRS